MTFMSVDVPEPSVRRLSEVKGRESEEGRDIYVDIYFRYLR